MAFAMIGSQTIVSVATEKQSETSQESGGSPEQNGTEQTEPEAAETDAGETADGEQDGEQSDGQESEGEVRCITGISALPTEQCYLTFEEKPSAEELADRFPALLAVTLDDAEEPEEIAVTWACDTDYEADWSGEGKECYTFMPVWDEESYVLSEEAAETVTLPAITVEVVHREAEGEIRDLETAQEELEEITEEKSILALVYLCDRYEVKAAPDAGADAVDTIACGQSVQIVGVELDEAGNAWYKVSLYDRDKNYTGYIEKRYLATSDEKFMAWTEEYVQKAQEMPKKKTRTISLMSSISSYPDVNQFPPSYQNKLLALKQQYPNWVFVKMETGVDFNTAVSQEMGDKSWISSSQPASWRNGDVEQSGWSYASEGILRYYMDPRNFLTESSIFQFEQLTYNESYHTESAVQSILAKSFMKGDIPSEGMTYAHAFTVIGRDLKVSPFHLASRVLQEQGVNGTSQLISGTYNDEFRGYYNYFNVGASGRDTELILNGLREAKRRGWNSRYASLRGGAEVIGKNYILRGQDTLYLQKFNVTNNSRYKHQYMQNIQAPASEAPGIRNAYAGTGSLNNSFVFKIPVYGNMPASACSQPDKTDTVTLNKTSIDDLAVDRTVKLTPYVNGSRVDSLSALTFTSNNTGVATVDAQGVVKAVSPGKATITCAKSGAKSGTCSVTVVKAEPSVDTPVLSPVVYKTGLKLSDISLPEGWRWSSADTLLAAGTPSYPAVYTPADTTRYLTATRQISIKVLQAIPTCSVPKGLTAKLGDSLGSIALPAGFTWESDPKTVLDQAGERTFFLTYDSGDSNYLVLNHIPTVVRVRDDNAQPQEPDDEYDGSQSGDGGGSGGGSGSGSGSGGSGSGFGGGSGGTGSGSGGGTGSGSGAGGSGGTTSQGSTGSGSTTSQGSTGSGSTTSQESTGGGTTSQESSGNGENTTSRESTGNHAPGGMEGPGVEENVGGSATSKESTGGGTTSRESTGGSSATASQENTGSGNTTSQGSTGSSDTTSLESGGGSAAGRNSTDGADNGTPDSGNGAVNGGESVQNNPNGSGSAGRIERRESNHTALLADADVAEDSGVQADGEENEEFYERPSVTMDLADVSILTDEMLQMAKEQNVDLLLRMNDRAVWHVNVGSVQGSFDDMDMAVLFKRGVIPQELLARFAGGSEYLEFSLAHDGAFGFGAQLEILLDPADCGRYANLFYYDAEAGALEFICASVIDENGYAVFDMEHASDYVIIVSDQPMTDGAAEDEASDAPDGGFAWGRVLLAAAIAVVAAALAAGGYFLYKLRREEDEEEDGDDEDDEEDEDDGEADDGADLEEISVDAGKQRQAAVETYTSAKSERRPAQREQEEKIQDIVADEESRPDIQNEEDDWIGDEDWHESEPEQREDVYADDHAEDDWIDDDEWDIANDWMDDDEWERKGEAGKKTGE